MASVNGSHSYRNIVRGVTTPHPAPRWADIYSKVKEIRRTYAHLFVKTPTNIKFRLLNENCLRIYFLLCPAQGREATVFYADLDLVHQNGCQFTRLQPHEVLDSNTTFSWRRASREEQLLSERRRCSVWGITHYQLSPRYGVLVFPASSTIFYCDHPPDPVCPVTPKELPYGSVRLNPQLCPYSPELIAYSANKDVYVFNAKTGKEHKISNCHNGSSRLEEDPFSAGVPAYVMQEEFARYKGYWWQPATSDHKKHLLYEEVDESKVQIVQLMSADQTSLEEFRFPRAGGENAVSRLRLAELTDSGALIRVLALSRELEHIAPWHQYLVRVGWTPCGNYVWCQLLDRRQRRLDLLLLPLAMFSVVHVKGSARTACSNESSTCASTQNGLLNNGGHVPMPITLLSEQHDSWIDVHDLLYWFENEEGAVRSFIWGSEESGHRHLYFYRVRLANGGVAQVQQRVQLTSGDWSVLSKGLWVDAARGHVYFMGLRDTPLENHLYVVNLHPGSSVGSASTADYVSPSNPQLLTTTGYSHSVYLHVETRIFVTCYSSINFPGASHVYRIYPSEQPGLIVSTRICSELLPTSPSEGLRELLPLVVPEMLPVKVQDGTVTLYAMVFKPHNLVRGRQYPTVLHVYGGPQVQLVTNTFKGFRMMRSHLLAAHDFVVVSIDSRGSENRGVAFQSHIRNRMGSVEISDQVEALCRLAEIFPFIDLTRVGVFGWSYGGYLALMALAQRGDLFKAAVAGAPVVNWLLYDTGYTERYMDIPENNGAGYKSSSVLSYVKNFPDEEGRLLIVQGIIDDNVHFSHTSILIQHLINHGKPYQLQVYPRERHCLRAPESNEHYDTTLLNFFLKEL